MKVLAIALLVIGIVCFGSSIYVKGQVNEGRMEIKSSQEKVDQGNSLFSLNPITKDIGKEFSGPVQKRIDEGTLEAQKYEEIASWLRIAGIIFVVTGIGVLFVCRKK